MGKINKAKTGKTGSLYTKFLNMTILPLVGLGLLVIIFCSITYTTAMQAQIKRGLRSVGMSVLLSYDELYDGDFNITVDEENKALFYKGDALLSGGYEYIDKLKEETGLDISLFFYDMRMLTTLTDREGNRCVGYTANERIVDSVLKGKKETFYNNTVVNNKKYLSYYIPVCGSDGTCIAMIAVKRPAEVVNGILYANVYKIIGIIVLAVLITAIFITGFAKRTVNVVNKIKVLLKEMAKGNLSSRLDHAVLARDDELGEMGRFTDYVQGALRKLVERDGLTGLYNRRTGENMLNAMHKKAKERGEKYALMLGDLDFLKKINDTYGHEAGDAAIKAISRVMHEKMNGHGYAARWGGEEFLLVMENGDGKAAEELAWEILKGIRELEISVNGNTFKVTMTIGVTDGARFATVREEIAKADELLYYGKEHGRNRVVRIVEG